MGSESENRTKPARHGFRTSIDDALRLERLAQKDGFQSVSAWAAHLTFARAELLEKHIHEGTYLPIRGLIVPYNEIPGGDANECRLANAETLFNNSPDDEALNRGIDWLVAVFRTGTEIQRTRAEALASSTGTDGFTAFQEALH